MHNGWHEVQLGEFVRLQRGHDLPSQDRREGAVPVVGAGGANGTHCVANVRGPGVVIGRSGVGFGTVWWCPYDFWAHNTALYVTDFLGNDPLFSYYRLSLFDFVKYNSGGLQPSLNRNFIYPIRLLVPPKDEQRRIAHLLRTWDEAIENTERLSDQYCVGSALESAVSSVKLTVKSKKLLERQKRGLMQKLLTGEWRVPLHDGDVGGLAQGAAEAAE